MTKWIRWQGLIVFLIASGIMGGLWFLLVDSFVEHAIEETGTLINGAKVELDHADLSIAPAGLTLTGVRVTNPDQPLSNAVEINRLVLSLDGLNLLLRKVIVDEMTIDGIQFNTPRETSGAIKPLGDMVEATVRAAVCGDYEFRIPSFEIPDIDQILENEDIRTLQIIESLQADILSEEGAWQTQINELPDQDTFENYRQRIAAITSDKNGIAGILGSAGEVKSLHAEIQKDINRIQNAQKTFSENLDSFQVQVELLANEPLSDLGRLSEKYNISPQGLENLSQQLLTVKFCDWLHEVHAIYERLEPTIERVREYREQRVRKEDTEGPRVVKSPRAKGVDVHFREYEPTPEFLVRIADVSALIQLGEVAGRLENVTLEPELVKEPLTFAFSGRELKDLESLELKGELNHMDPSNPEDVADLLITGFRFGNLVLSENEAFPITLREGLADIRVDARLNQGQIEADVLAGFQSIKIDADLMKDAAPLVRAILPSLFDIRDLTVAAGISGTLANYDISISSDLDQVLSDAVNEMVKTQTSNFQNELKVALSEKVNEAMSELDLDLASFGAIGDELTDRLNEGTDLLKPPEGKSKLPFGIKLPF